MKNIARLKIGLILLLCLGLSLSCGGKVTTRTEEPVYKFTINGVVVKDMNSGKDISYFSILRDSKPFSGAVVTVGSDTLEDQGNGNYYMEGSALFAFGGSISVEVSSVQDDFTVSKLVEIPGSLSILELPADDKYNVGGHSVIVSWTASVKASGYFLSTVKPDGLPGYTERDLDKNRSENVPPDAFRTNQDNLVEGSYKVYVVAYWGGFPYYYGFPFDLPSGIPTGNIDGANGTIGAGVISQYVTIEVTSG
jgi:hypothetical protein